MELETDWCLWDGHRDFISSVEKCDLTLASLTTVALPGERSISCGGLRTNGALSSRSLCVILCLTVVIFKVTCPLPVFPKGQRRLQWCYPRTHSQWYNNTNRPSVLCSFHHTLQRRIIGRLVAWTVWNVWTQRVWEFSPNHRILAPREISPGFISYLLGG